MSDRRMITRTCAGCDVEFQAARSSAKYHDATCRQRAYRRKKAAVPPVEEEAELDVAVLTAVQRELRDAGRLDTWLGQQACRLAKAISAPQAGSAVAALSVELRAVMAEAMAKRESGGNLARLRSVKDAG